MISIHYYDTPGTPPAPSVFLAGPTTDAAGGEWVGSYRGHKLSRWRAELAQQLELMGFEGTLIIPEFEQPGDFRAQAARTWPDPPKGPRSAPLLWEDSQMARATIVALWLDVAIEGPNRGLSARPEASELFFRSQLPQGSWTWRINSLAFGVPTRARKVGRYEGFAQDLGCVVWRTLPELARAIVELWLAIVARWLTMGGAK